MPTIPIENREQYRKALEVLIREGGSWQGIGQDKRYLVVNQAQYQAIIEAGITNPKQERRSEFRF